MCVLLIWQQRSGPRNSFDVQHPLVVNLVKNTFKVFITVGTGVCGPENIDKY